MHESNIVIIDMICIFFLISFFFFTICNCLFFDYLANVFNFTKFFFISLIVTSSYIRNNSIIMQSNTKLRTTLIYVIFDWKKNSYSINTIPNELIHDCVHKKQRKKTKHICNCILFNLWGRKCHTSYKVDSFYVVTIFCTCT